MFTKVAEAQEAHLEGLRESGKGYPAYAGYARVALANMAADADLARKALEHGNTAAVLKYLENIISEGLNPPR